MDNLPLKLFSLLSTSLAWLEVFFGLAPESDDNSVFSEAEDDEYEAVEEDAVDEDVLAKLTEISWQFSLTVIVDVAEFDTC